MEFQRQPPPIDISRRIKLYKVSPRDILAFIYGRATPPDCVFLPVNKALPDDAQVMSVNYDYLTRYWNVAICSKEFDVVPDGEQIPYANSHIEWASYKLEIPTPTIQPGPVVVENKDAWNADELKASIKAASDSVPGRTMRQWLRDTK